MNHSVRPFHLRTDDRNQVYQHIYGKDNLCHVAQDQVSYEITKVNVSTAKGLAALIHQKYIVTDLFADALYSALSSIEDVLDSDLMPDPMEFLPATDEYPADRFAPNPARAELFKSLTFVFLDEKQYNNLVIPINAGLGKAVEYDPDRKTVDDLVKYASTKGQVLLVQRNTDEDDTLCIEAAKRYGPSSK